MTAETSFTTEDIALAIEIPGVYDGTSCWLLKDGRLVNRWADSPWSGRYRATQEWIDAHGDELRATNVDLLTPEETE